LSPEDSGVPIIKLSDILERKCNNDIKIKIEEVLGSIGVVHSRINSITKLIAAFAKLQSVPNNTPEKNEKVFNGIKGIIRQILAAISVPNDPIKRIVDAIDGLTKLQSVPNNTPEKNEEVFNGIKGIIQDSVSIKEPQKEKIIALISDLTEQSGIISRTREKSEEFSNDINAIIHHTVRDARYTMAAIGLGLSGNLMALSSIFFLSGTASIALLSAGSVFVISGIGVAGKLYFDNKAFNEEQLNQNQQQQI
jgi:hypothetical protein